MKKSANLAFALALTTSSPLFSAVVVFPSSSGIAVNGLRVVTDSETNFLKFNFGGIVATTSIDFDVDSSEINIRGVLPETTASSTISGSSRVLLGFTPPVFPNPPQPIYETASFEGTATIVFPETTFETGLRPFRESGGRFVFDSSFVEQLSAHVSVSYLFSRGGETMIGEADFSLDYFLRGSGTGVINGSDYPNSLSVSFPFGLSPVDLQQPPIPIGNGLSIQVPEVSSSVLLLFGLAFCARRRR
jgi:hypothetical protein